MNKILMALMVTVIAGSCATTQKGNDLPSLMNKRWTLTGWGENNVASPQTMKEVFINFNEEQVNGQSGCNNFFGGYTVKKNTINFQKLGSTMMACNEESMDTEQKFHAMLERANKFKVANDILVLYHDSEILAQFK